MRRINQSSERKKERKKEKKKKRKKASKNIFFHLFFFSICIYENELIIYLLRSYDENQYIF